VSFFKVKRPWTRQPPPGTPIDPSNQFGVVFAAITDGRTAYDSVSRTQGIQTGVESVTSQKWGRTARLADIADDITFGNIPGDLVTESKDISILAIFRPVASTGSNRRIVQRTETADDGFSFVYPDESTERLQFSVNKNAAPNFTSSANGDVPLDEWTVAIGTARYNTLNSYVLRLYINGVDRTGQGSTNSIGTGDTDTFFIGKRRDIVDSPWAGDFALLIVADREWTERTAKQLTDNPWQIFEPETVYYPLTQAAASSLYFPVKQDWSIQPPTAVEAEIDWTNPIARKLGFLYVGPHTGGAYGRDLVSGNLAAPGYANGGGDGDPTNAPEPGLFRTARTIYQPRSSSSGYIYIDGLDIELGDETFLFTQFRLDGYDSSYPTLMMARTDTAHGDSYNIVLTQYVGWGTSSVQRVGIYAGDESGDLSTYWDNPIGAWPFLPVSVEFATVGYNVEWGANNCVGYFNGIPDATPNSQNFSGAANVPINRVDLCGNSIWASEGLRGEISLQAIFTEGLTEAEAKSLHNNPWQLIKPQTVWYKIGEEQTIFITSVDADDAWVDGTTGLIALGGGFL
jgi:hypothetical protein